MSTEWREAAACKGMDPSLFFIERGDDARPAKAVCAECPVREPCLEEAMAQPERLGVWGGLSERERRGMRRGRAQVTAELRARREQVMALDQAGLLTHEIAAQLRLPARTVRADKFAMREEGAA